MNVFEFKINEVMPIGLAGEGQRPMHTNVFGRLLKGSIKIGDIVHVPCIDGTEQRAAIKGLMTECKTPEPFPEMLTVNAHGKVICGMSIIIPPSEANQIALNGIIWSDNS